MQCIRSGTGLGKNAEKARQMSGDAETSRRGNVPGQGADVKTEIKTKEAPVVDKTGVRAKMVVGTTIEP